VPGPSANAPGVIFSPAFYLDFPQYSPRFPELIIRLDSLFLARFRKDVVFAQPTFNNSRQSPPTGLISFAAYFGAGLSSRRNADRGSTMPDSSLKSYSLRPKTYLLGAKTERMATPEELYALKRIAEVEQPSRRWPKRASLANRTATGRSHFASSTISESPLRQVRTFPRPAPKPSAVLRQHQPTETLSQRAATKRRAHETAANAKFLPAAGESGMLELGLHL